MGRECENRSDGKKRAASALTTSTEHLQVGQTVTITGRNLPANRALELRWETVAGDWETERKNQIVGVDDDARTDRLGSVRTDGRGRFEASVTVPEDFGGSHTVSARTAAGETVGECEVTVRPRFELDGRTAPLGGTFTLTGYGLGPADLRNHYRVLWDNGTVGYVTGLGNRGTATAHVRAVGPPGDHVLQVGPLHRHGSFLAADATAAFESVAGHGREDWTVEVTAPESRPEPMWGDPVPAETPIAAHYPPLDRETDATLSVSPRSGRAGTVATVEGDGFEPGAAVDLVWHTHRGRRRQGMPIKPRPRPDVLPTVTADAEGRFRTEVTIPRGLGGTRPITAEIDDESVAATGFVLQPGVLDVTPERGPAGTEITIELTGAGWALYENSLCLVYDNKHLGYVCGGAGRANVENPGTVETVIRATGEPGLHFVDLYPNVFRVGPDAPAFENVPHLSAPETHPVRPLPSLHYTVEITE